MKKRILKVIIVYFIIGLCGLLLAILYKKIGRGIPCVFYEITGLKCGGCGNTTAVLSILKLDFKSAFFANMFMPFEFMYVIYAAFRFTMSYIKKSKVDMMLKPEWVNILFLVLLLLWSVLRNIFVI